MSPHTPKYHPSELSRIPASIRAFLLPLFLLAASACGDEGEIIPTPNTTCNPNPDEATGTICTKSNVITTGELTGEIFSMDGLIRKCRQTLRMTPRGDCRQLAAPAYYWFQAKAPNGFKSSHSGHLMEGDTLQFAVDFASK